MANSDSRKSDADLDVSLEAPKKKSSRWGSVLALLLGVLIVVFVISAYVYRQKEEADRLAREQARTAQVSLLGTEIMGAIPKVQAGDTRAGVEMLRKASGKLKSIVAEADAAGDDNQDIALLRQRQVTLDKAALELSAQQDALTKALVESLQTAGGNLGGVSKNVKGGAPATGPAAAVPAPAIPAPPPAKAAAPPPAVPAVPAPAKPGAPAAPAPVPGH
jgi:hypothetical protein